MRRLLVGWRKPWSRIIALVYGGGNAGLVDIIADEVIRLGGRAAGVIPAALLQKERGHKGLTQLNIVKDMHERKAMMADLSDGLIVMPGGVRTLEELFKVFTWAQLGFHQKPIGLLNVDGFYHGLLEFHPAHGLATLSEGRAGRTADGENAA